MKRLKWFIYKLKVFKINDRYTDEDGLQIFVYLLIKSGAEMSCFNYRSNDFHKGSFKRKYNEANTRQQPLCFSEIS